MGGQVGAPLRHHIGVGVDLIAPPAIGTAKGGTSMSLVRLP